MEEVYNERLEPLPKMNQRVVLHLVRSFLNHTDEMEKVNMFADNRWNAYNYSSNLGIKPYETPKLNDRHRGFRFHFTY
jgi:hypothetical protein